MRDEERIRCPVHDLISFKRSRDEDRLLWTLIQTRPIQRLRRIKQLGFSEFVYPGATHTRFSHSLGAMQMARRMLDVFQKNNGFENIQNLEQERNATLAAALLHDIGHGPYSHVFEEVCDDVGVNKDHEAYTLDLIDGSGIRSILEEFGIYDRVRRFFTEEPGYSVFNSIISSQLDCDRLDFLCRDRHHTGIRSAALDLAWLFDSLRIERVYLDDEGETTEYSFVFSEKGLAVAEEFVISYMKMYDTVYFHKTTRGVQHLVKDMLLQLLRNDSERSEIRNLPLFKFFKDPNLELYERLDDSAILTAAHIASENAWGLSTDLAKRYLRREPYKCFELPSTQTGNIGRNKLDRFRAALNGDNIYFVEDVLARRNYKQHAVTDSSFLKNILIKHGGEHESLGAVSSLLTGPVVRVARIYFRSHEDREKATAIFQSC